MTIIVGHKGAAGYATGNTIESFKKAIEIGCNRTEMDVRLSKDNVVILFHDKELSNSTNGIGDVGDMNYLEISKLEYTEGGKIPTLQKVIDICKNKINLQIELKSEGTPKHVNDLIINNNIEDSVVITSFKIDLLKEIKELNPNLKVGLLFRKEDIMQNIWNLTNDIPLDFLAPFSGIITEDFLCKAKKIGKTVYAYMVNDEKTGNKLISMGVDEIGTDFPLLFIK